MRKNNKKERIIDTRLSVSNYIEIVNTIVDGYFDFESEIYQPHIGIATCMMTYYNNLYKSKNDEFIVDVVSFQDVVDDAEFMQSFNKAIELHEGFAFDFAHAYYDALDIIENKKSSIERMFSTIRVEILKLMNHITDSINKDEMQELVNIAKSVESGDINPSNVIDIAKKFSN